MYLNFHVTWAGVEVNLLVWGYDVSGLRGSAEVGRDCRDRGFRGLGRKAGKGTIMSQ
jgi:hypothetical protein